MILVFLFLIISIFLVSAEFRKGFSSYDIFYCGVIIFVLIGWLSAYFLSDQMYVLEGNTKLLDDILLDVSILFIVSTLFLLLQKKSKQEPINFNFFKKNYPVFLNAAVVITVIFCLIVIVSVDVNSSPLLNIGNYDSREMSYYRSILYDTNLMNILNVPRYIIFYMVIPIFFLLKGFRFKIPTIVLLLFLFTSLLTLSKTMFLIITFFYFIGRFLYSKKISTLIWFIIVSVIGYYLIVYFTYFLTVERSFLDVFNQLYIRLIATPIALSAVYAEIFNYNQGFRSSVYYTYVFGGEFASIPIKAMQYIAPHSGGNAPTGMIGMAYPNLPRYLHCFFYLVYILFVFVTSHLFKYINKQFVRILLIVLFGVLSWFLFLTEPLVALNSYGLLYIFVGTIVYLLLTKKIHR